MGRLAAGHLAAHDRTALGLAEIVTAAVKAATTPRYGPAVIDLPVNVQMSDVGAMPELPSKKPRKEERIEVTVRAVPYFLVRCGVKRFWSCWCC